MRGVQSFSKTLALSLMALLGACSPGHSQDRAQDKPFEGKSFEALPPSGRKVPLDAVGLKSSFAPVVQKVAPAVVNVYAKSITRQQVDPFWSLFTGREPQNRVQESLGSGVMVRKDGIVVTNNHVVEGAQSFMIVLNDRREYPAKVLLTDPRTDLAVLKIQAPSETFTTIDLDDGHDQQVGDLVLAIGNPFGVGQTVTNGIISALNRTDVGSGEGAYIQTDAAINPGNSGGALVDMNGQLIGINSFILSRSGSSAGVGFAIPSQMVRRVVDSALGGSSTVKRPWLGAHGEAVTSDIAKSLGLSRPEGVLITDVYPNSAADRAGLKQGDVVVAVDNERVNDNAGLMYQITLLKLGTTARLNVMRSGKSVNLTLRAEAPASSPARDERVLKGENPLSGAHVVNLSPALAEEIGIDPFSAPKGVMVYSIESAQSYAASVGLRPGDIIKSINGTDITTTALLEAKVKEGARRWQVSIIRNGQVITATFR
jgi:Do/DeqQ family serine protease